jgi:hypothetical protein
MTPRTPQCEVFFPLLLSSEHAGVPEDSNSQLFQVLGFTPTLGQSRGATLLPDFEKTFDRIEWGFLFPTLSKLRFCPTWIQWISSLYWLVSSSVKVNGEPREDFRLVRSVRQGCPLAPYLFILVMDVLGHMLDDPKHEIDRCISPKGDASEIKWMTPHFTLRDPQVT